MIVQLVNAERQLPCPQCGKPCQRHDPRSRRWRHLDTCQFATIVTAEVPRISSAVDQVRRAENRALLEDGDPRLKGTWYLWLCGPAMTSEARREALEDLRNGSLRTACAWAIKELAAGQWQYHTRGWARHAWMRWYSWAIRSRLEPLNQVTRKIKRHLPGILNAVEVVS